MQDSSSRIRPFGRFRLYDASPVSHVCTAYLPDTRELTLSFATDFCTASCRTPSPSLVPWTWCSVKSTDNRLGYAKKKEEDDDATLRAVCFVFCNQDGRRRIFPTDLPPFRENRNRPATSTVVLWSMWRTWGLVL
jgi:hypothetical protein